MPLVALLRNEVNVEALSVEIAIEFEQVHFQQQFFAANCGSIAEAGDTRMTRQAGAIDTHRKNAAESQRVLRPAYE